MWRGEKGVTSSRRCIAAGAWLLAAGLLVSAGGGATAFADAGSKDSESASSSSAANGGAADTGSGTGQGAPGATGGEAHDDAATTPGVALQTARSDTDHSDPATKPTTSVTRSPTETVEARQFSADAASTTDQDTAEASDDAAPAGDPTPPTDTDPTSDVASPPTTYEVQSSPAETPPSDEPAFPTDDPTPPTETSAVVTSENAVPVIPPNDPPSDSEQVPPASSPDQAASTPESAAPVPDVTSVVEEVLTPTTEAVVPPAPPAIDWAFLLGTSEDQLVADDASNRRSADHGRPTMSPLQILQLLTQFSGSPSAGKATEIPTLLDGANDKRPHSAVSAVGTSRTLAGTTSTSMAARLQPDAALPEGLQTFWRSYGEIIVAASLSAMFAAALPGLVGLVIPVAAGMHIGYRQAKAGRALHASGIAHLAAAGPIGVVRTGSLVALRPQRWRLPPQDVGDRSQDVA